MANAIKEGMMIGNIRNANKLTTKKCHRQLF